MSPDPPGTLRFACQPGCTKCCEVSGWVYLTEEDLQRAAAFVGLTTAEFESRYVYRTRHQRRLRKPPGAQCHFLVDGGCSIHPVKPVQCRAFPFWPELVKDRRAWKATGKYCPGIGRGDLIPLGEALEVSREMETAYPRQY